MQSIDTEEFKELIGKTITEATLMDDTELILKFSDGTALKIITSPTTPTFEGKWRLMIDSA